uniref:NADH-ubiquinone oxidoreductase chain 5 n=1 Tax=Rhacodactylus willihenkeli TaxID=3061933 RepID=A0AA50IA23_9SAUR|nr:NADH dehydrogenase subunit 5 [Rhacodactylus sp. KGeiss-2023a]
MQNLLFHAFMAASLITLLFPLLLPTNMLKKWNYSHTTKIAWMLSLPPALILVNTGTSSIVTTFNWFNTSFSIQISFLFDLYSTIFISIAIFVTWAISQFTNWYMADDPNINQFSKYLLLFLITMLILTTANNMLQLFIGWEGVGIMSFMLIGWWYSRMNANSAALQAVIYNRVGDIGLILSLTWMATYLNTWEIQQMFSQQHLPTLPLLGLILAAMGKSAQIGLHPWLPAAMEGPTPVSALLHSSTMVVAGVFLLVRLSPALQTNPTATSTCLLLGATTTLFAAICAVTQNDIKKIIAFSTSSQLGLMMVAVGLNQPELAFLHITTHAFFKAMLFLCSGSLIHNLSNEQDIRKMGGMQKLLPITTSCMTLGSLALTGTPFLAGFYSKDAIIEAMNTSNLNAWALVLTLIATSLTAAYSLRIIFYTQMHLPRYQSSNYPNENNHNLTSPLIRLAIGSMVTGLLMTSMTTLNKTQITTMPTTTKLSALLVTILGLMYAMELALNTNKLSQFKHTSLHTFSTQLGFFNTLMHRIQPHTYMKQGQHLALQLNDLLWYEMLGPKTMLKFHQMITQKTTTTHKGLIKTYLAIFIATTITTTLWTSFYTAR